MGVGSAEVVEIVIRFDGDQLVTEVTGAPPERPTPERPGWPEPAAEPDDTIAAWWTDAQDARIRELVIERRWWWYWSATDELVAITNPDALATWRGAIGSGGPVWYNRIMHFAVDRALRTGLYAELLGDAATVTCGRCGASIFEPDGRGRDLAYRIDVCNACIRSCVWEPTVDNRAGRQTIVAWVATLAEILGRVPPAALMTPRASDLGPLSTEQRIRFLDHVRVRPGEAVIRRRLGSWLNALVVAGVLPDGTRRTSRGTQSVAVDGHICYSIGEKTIDDFLTTNGVDHEREPSYPQGRYRGDFLIAGAIVEYFGLAGSPTYDAKTEEKLRLCAEAGVRLIALYAEDLPDPARLSAKLLD
jgi:hypothetical protein